MSLIDEMGDDCGFRGNQQDTIKHQIGCPICSKKLVSWFEQCHKDKGTAIICLCGNCKGQWDKLIGNKDVR